MIAQSFLVNGWNLEKFIMKKKNFQKGFLFLQKEDLKEKQLEKVQLLI